MTTYFDRRAIGWMLVAALMAGCSTDREQAVIGKWRADSSPVGMAIRAAKLKHENPNASTGEIMGAARGLGLVAVNLRKDKTCDLTLGVNKAQGDWSFNKESGEVTLNLKSAEVNVQAPGQESFKPQTWVAYVEENNRTMRLYMTSPEAAATLRKSDKPLAGSIVLSKRS